MNYFMKQENVENYLNMVEDYDATWVVEQVAKYLPEGATLLELGMGPGKDLEQLFRRYDVVGSDNSELFLEKFREKHTGIKVMYVDAMTIDIVQTFDCIYSNKVLHHLTREEFMQSLSRQKNKLTPQGILFMTLWKGTYEEEMMFDGEIRFTYYLEEDIRALTEELFDVVAIETYAEMEAEDSLLVVLKNKK